MSVNTILSGLIASCVALATVATWVFACQALITTLGVFFGLLALMLVTTPLFVGGVVAAGAAYLGTSALIGDRAERGIAKVKSFFAR